MNGLLTSALLALALTLPGCCVNDDERMHHDISRAREQVHRDMARAREDVRRSMREARDEIRQAADETRRELRQAARDICDAIRDCR